jgi:hypothetical protein
MNPFVDAESAAIGADSGSNTSSVARLKVVLAGFFTYEMLLTKTDGRSLSVGSASDNAIVIPQPEVAAHQLEIFYARGQLWVESAEIGQIIDIEGIPLSDTKCLSTNSPLKVGGAQITLLEE